MADSNISRPASSISHYRTGTRSASVDDNLQSAPNLFIKTTQGLTAFNQTHRGGTRNTSQGLVPPTIPFGTACLSDANLVDLNSPSPHSQTLPGGLKDENKDGPMDDDDLPDISMALPTASSIPNFTGQFTKVFAKQMVRAFEAVTTKLGKQESSLPRARIQDPNVFKGLDPRKL